MKNYEIMYIVRTDIAEDEVKATVKKYEKIFNDYNATITLSKELGQKEFAYEIKKHKNGFYYLYNISVASDEVVKEFERVAGYDENILRQLVLNLDK